MKLFPLLAKVFAQGAADAHVSEKFDQLMKEIQVSNFKSLDLLHHYTSGMKSVFS